MLRISKEPGEVQASSGQIGRLKTILHQYWPTQVNEILATLFMDTDPIVKHLAFLLLGHQALPSSPSSPVRL